MSLKPQRKQRGRRLQFGTPFSTLLQVKVLAEGVQMVPKLIWSQVYALTKESHDRQDIVVGLDLDH